MREGGDYSWARPGGAALRAFDWTFAVRYVPYPGDGGKGLTADELADLRAHDIAVALVFESTGGRMLDGLAAGQVDGAASRNAAATLGFPTDTAIYFACDFDAQPGQFGELDAYLAGAASVLGFDRVGIYGSYAVVEHCRAAGTARWLWQTYAWSGGRVSEGAHLYQYRNGQTIAGGAVDFVRALQSDFGQWEADDMTPEQVRAIAEEQVSGIFLALLKQAIGVDESTFSDAASVEAIRAKLAPQGGGGLKRGDTVTLQ